MKIALLNTYLHGGAGAAAVRLEKALNAAGADARLISAQKPLLKYAESAAFWPFEKSSAERFQFSAGRFGEHLAKNEWVKQADIVHLHWINQGFLNLTGIQNLLALQKPIIWTMHDQWPFTGGCHYSRGCLNFQKTCGQCLYLKHAAADDFSNQIWKKKAAIWGENAPQKIHFVACSEWLAEIARGSSLLKNADVRAIPNPIDTDIFQPLSAAERLAERSKWGIRTGQKVLLFVAAKVSDERKGFVFLEKSLDFLHSQKPDTELVIAVLGKMDAGQLEAIPFPTVALGFVSEAEKLRLAYGMADAFVIPSLEDNLPNTVMESLACGTPVLGFETGGIPEMVDHLGVGFLAPQKDFLKLAEGIIFLFSDEKRLTSMREKARQKAVLNYANAIVADRFLKLYEQILL